MYRNRVKYNLARFFGDIKTTGRCGKLKLWCVVLFFLLFFLPTLKPEAPAMRRRALLNVIRELPS